MNTDALFTMEFWKLLKTDLSNVITILRQKKNIVSEKVNDRNKLFVLAARKPGSGWSNPLQWWKFLFFQEENCS